MNLNKMSKDELEAYAREHHDVELDKRLHIKKLVSLVSSLDVKPEVVKAAVVDVVYEAPKVVSSYIVRNPNGSQYVTKDIEEFARVHGFTVKSMRKLGWVVTPNE